MEYRKGANRYVNPEHPLVWEVYEGHRFLGEVVATEEAIVVFIAPYSVYAICVGAYEATL